MKTYSTGPPTSVALAVAAIAANTVNNAMPAGVADHINGAEPTTWASS